MFFNYTTQSTEHPFESEEWDYVDFDSGSSHQLSRRYCVLDKTDKHLVVGFIDEQGREMYDMLPLDKCKFMSDSKEPIYDFTEIWENQQ